MIQTKGTILCALCGIKFIPSAGSICPACTLKNIEQIKTLQGDDIVYCRYCERYERPPWINCQRQSQELLAILLKKVKGINKVSIKNAIFLWTQPHSKRMKLKITFERQINEKMKVQMTQIVEFIQKYSQCTDCKKKFTPHDWSGVVQVRQHVNHKKTFHHLEQILLKQKIGQKIIKTSAVDNGVNFYFNSENDSQRFVEFFKTHLPVSIKSSKQLISHSEQNSTSNVKNAFSLTLPKICKEDLVKIPRKLSKQLGSCCEVLLCTKVSSFLHFVDLRTFKKIQISGTQYFLFQNQIQIYPLKYHGKKFNLLDCEEKEKEKNGHFKKFSLTVMREDEYKQLYTICHFDEEPGRDLMGYDLEIMDNFEDVKNLPDLIMVKRIKDPEEKKKKRSQKRREEAKKKKEEAEIQKKSRLNEAQDREDWSDEDDDEEDNEWVDIKELQGKDETQVQGQVKKQQ